VRIIMMHWSVLLERSLGSLLNWHFVGNLSRRVIRNVKWRCVHGDLKLNASNQPISIFFQFRLIAIFSPRRGVN
jgi:hypothetical protein